MSRTRPTVNETEQLVYPCDTCSTRPGRWCRTRSERWSPYLHADRWYQWQASLEASPPRLSEVDPRLVAVLTDCGAEWGPLGVLRVAYQLWPDAAGMLVREREAVW